MSRRKVAELDTPFSSVEWPSVSQEDQDSILELLCSLLEPIGQHRRNHAVPSAGKRSRRKAKAAAANRADTNKDASNEANKDAKERRSQPVNPGTATKTPPVPPPPPPPPPELARFVDVGLVSISRELVGQMRAPPTPPEEQPPPQTPYAAVFVVRSGHPSAFYSHLPQIVAASSPPPPLLVGFSRSCEDRLSAVLGVPRVSSIALRAGAPQAQGLLSFLGEKVSPVRAAWLDEAVSGRFRDTQIHMADVAVGPKRKKK